MITAEGKNHIKRYLAGWVPSIGQALAFGVGNASENPGDTKLHLEAGRSPLTLTTYDFANNRLIFKAAVPDEYVGKIYEVGLFSLAEDPSEFNSRFITTFDSATENWLNPADSTDSSFGSTANRLGADGLVLAPAANASATASLGNVQYDLSGFSNTDSFTFAYNVTGANTNQINFRFMVDASNYYTFSMGAQTDGYKIAEVTKGAATVTGTPTWSTINEIQVNVQAKSAGATSVEFDAIRLEDRDSINPDYVLVARKVLTSARTKVEGQPMDIEFPLSISVP